MKSWAAGEIRVKLQCSAEGGETTFGLSLTTFGLSYREVEKIKDLRNRIPLDSNTFRISLQPPTSKTH